MGQEQIRVVVASGASTSASFEFSRTYPLYGIHVGTMSTGTVFGIHAKSDDGSTFYEVMNPVNPQTATVSNLTMQIGSNVGKGGGFINVAGGFKAGRVVLTGVVSGGVSFNIIGYDG